MTYIAKQVINITEKLPVIFIKTLGKIRDILMAMIMMALPPISFAAGRILYKAK